MIHISEFKNILPHQGQMLWVDYIVSAREDGGECLIKLDKSKHYFSENGLRQTAYIEWMAQGFGFVSAMYHSQNNHQSIEKAFLVAIEKMSFSEIMPVEGDEVMVEVKHIRTVGPLSYVEGRVYLKEKDLTYCRGLLKLFSA